MLMSRATEGRSGQMMCWNRHWEPACQRIVIFPGGRIVYAHRLKELYDSVLETENCRKFGTDPGVHICNRSTQCSSISYKKLHRQQS